MENIIFLVRSGFLISLCSNDCFFVIPAVLLSGLLRNPSCAQGAQLNHSFRIVLQASLTPITLRMVVIRSGLLRNPSCAQGAQLKGFLLVFIQTSLSVHNHKTFVIRSGFEPETHSLEGCCSIQLSYRTGSFLP